jgi:small subunit ribosomal protein S3
VEDYNIRKYLKNKLYSTGIPAIEIERDSKRVHIIINCARPGFILGRAGNDSEKLRADLEKMIGKPTKLTIQEVKRPDASAQLVAENIAQQLEKRISFRRAMKQSMQRSMKDSSVKGIKTQVSGRLGGAEIARVEHYHEGTIPLQTLRADIDYGFSEAKTTYGRIGVKVWIYKGEVLSGGNRMGPRVIEAPRPRSERPERRDDRNRGSGNFNRGGGDHRPGGPSNSRPGGGGGYRPQGSGDNRTGSAPQNRGNFSGPRPTGPATFNRPPRPDGPGRTEGGNK